MRSIRRTITLSLLASVLTVCLFLFVLVVIVARQEIVRQFDQALRSKAEAIAGLIKMDGDHVVMERFAEVVGEYRLAEHHQYFEVCDESGETIFSSTVEKMPMGMAGKGWANPAARRVFFSDGRVGRAVTIQAAAHVKAEYRQDEHASDFRTQSAIVRITVASDTRDIDGTIFRVSIAVGAAFAILAVGVIILVPFVVRKGLQPLERLSTQAADISASTLSMRFATDAMPTELVSIATSLNASLERLNESFLRERHFAANAAHELRTPLAAIRANAEVALQWPDPAQTVVALREVLQSVKRMQQLMERLLELARLGSEESSILPVEIDVASVVRDSLAAAEMMFSRRGLSVRSELPEVKVKSDMQLLSSLVDNIVFNAARHSEAHSTVVIEIRCEETISLVVSNETRELEAADMDQLFKPLWTKSSDRGAGNTGLGLALVMEYSRILGAIVRPTLRSKDSDETGEKLKTSIFSLMVIFPKP